MQRFELHRTEDLSGSSGTGIVAQGVIFSDGRVAMRWLIAPHSTGLYDSAGDLLAIHGHEDRTRLVVIDQPVPGEAS